MLVAHRDHRVAAFANFQPDARQGGHVEILQMTVEECRLSPLCRVAVEDGPLATAMRVGAALVRAGPLDEPP